MQRVRGFRVLSVKDSIITLILPKLRDHPGRGDCGNQGQWVTTAKQWYLDITGQSYLRTHIGCDCMPKVQLDKIPAWMGEVVWKFHT